MPAAGPRPNNSIFQELQADIGIYVGGSTRGAGRLIVPRSACHAGGPPLVGECLRECTTVPRPHRRAFGWAEVGVLSDDD